MEKSPKSQNRIASLTQTVKEENRAREDESRKKKTEQKKTKRNLRVVCNYTREISKPTNTLMTKRLPL